MVVFRTLVARRGYKRRRTWVIHQSGSRLRHRTHIQEDWDQLAEHC
jgi:hypothetical protein